ncbi:hypothetical protein ABZ636_19035 [Streptomyces sp. NPDC007251]|uniref:hypothetical protein n=1 Tax=Streptomyces sp. NPDC007251 TaxID=3154483 RepID=UPI0033FCF9CA
MTSVAAAVRSPERPGTPPFTALLAPPLEHHPALTTATASVLVAAMLATAEATHDLHPLLETVSCLRPVRQAGAGGERRLSHLVPAPMTADRVVLPLART